MMGRVIMPTEVEVRLEQSFQGSLPNWLTHYHAWYEFDVALVVIYHNATTSCNTLQMLSLLSTHEEICPIFAHALHLYGLRRARQKAVVIAVHSCTWIFTAEEHVHSLSLQPASQNCAVAYIAVLNIKALVESRKQCWTSNTHICSGPWSHKKTCTPLYIFDCDICTTTHFAHLGTPRSAAERGKIQPYTGNPRFGLLRPVAASA